MTSTQLMWAALALVPPLTAAAVSSLLMYLLRKAAPPRGSEQATAISDELRKEYERWEMRSTRAFAALTLAVTGIFWLCFSMLGASRLGHLPSAVYTFGPESLDWAALSLFLSLVVASLITDYWLRRAMKDKCEGFKAYLDLKHKFDSDRLVPILLNLVCLFSAICAFLMLDYYQYFSADRIVSNGFFSFHEEVYPLNQVSDITFSHTVHNIAGERIHRGYGVYLVTFSTGQKWSSDDFMLDSSEGGRKKELMDFISQNAGVPIREIPEYAYGDY